MNKRHQQQSKFLTLENHFLNTFFSGLYFSAADFIAIGHKNGIAMQMHSREMLIKDLLNKSDENGILAEVIASLNNAIDDRISECHRLSLEYPGARAPLAKLAQKATGTKALLAREVRGNPYEH
ncbi:MAG: hypothetical protein JU82_07130 [Sulfuricurvum sp. MLSB]|uniref:hypothetical protein n=1 Tax=unclassified Sulfuricurvum TaxID=2632390 RepID=UPI000502EEA7|nr:MULTISPECIES: hypothetical protein [unclassified Sulfuricurvum]KFN39424.1 MAG: hypothetical protein JU82_07130 [Sulfuricurvum sp. MLSB]